MYSSQFWKLCFACLLFFCSFNMVIPDMDLLLGKIGAKQYTWLVIPVFAFVALISRPFSGKLTDSIGRVRVMCIGAVVTTLACCFYLFIPVAILFFANRAFHGLCAGFTPTGFTAFADDIVPLEKRGEAMGIVGICNNIGNAIGWVLGSQITNQFSAETTFIIAAILGFLSFLIFTTLKEVAVVKQKFTFHLLKINKDELFEKRVWVAGVVMLLTVFSSGAVFALIAQFSQHLSIPNKGTYMGIYISSSLIVRFLAGRWSDKYGRRRIAFAGTLFLVLSMLLLAFATSMFLFAFSAVVFGIAWGLLSPSLFAWAADVALVGKKGKAIGTLFMFMEGGIIIGSSICGILYNGQAQNFKFIFLLCTLFALLAGVFMLLRVKGKVS